MIMGQRTQMLIIKHSRDGQKKVEFYHHQWGYGRNMFLAVMFLYMRYYGTSSLGYCTGAGKPEERRAAMERDFIFEVGNLDGMGGFIHENTGPYWKERWQDILDRADINDIDSIYDACEMGDNNNGWCVVDITPSENRYGNPKFKVGWLLGREDAYGYRESGRRDGWVTAEKYAKSHGGGAYSDGEFVRMYLSFCGYFGIKDIAGDPRC